MSLFVELASFYKKSLCAVFVFIFKGLGGPYSAIFSCHTHTRIPDALITSSWEEVGGVLWPSLWWFMNCPLEAGMGISVFSLIAATRRQYTDSDSLLLKSEMCLSSNLCSNHDFTTHYCWPWVSYWSLHLQNGDDDNGDDVNWKCWCEGFSENEWKKFSRCSAIFCPVSNACPLLYTAMYTYCVLICISENRHC